MMVALKNNGYKILMISATAATIITEMRNFGYATQLHNGYNYYEFAKDHGAVFDRFGGMTVTTDNTGMQRVHNKLFNVHKCAHKMNIKDFDTLFPDNQIIAESFDLEKSDNIKMQGIYDTMHEEIAKLDERAADYSSHIFAIIMKARRLSELCKVPVTTEWINYRYEAGISPVAFFNFSDSLEAVEQRLRKTYDSSLICKIVGGQTEKARETLLEEFAADKRRIALVNISAGNASISLHDLHGNYPRESLICPSWSAIMTLQALGRIYRAKGKTKCVQKFLYASDIEERQRSKVAMKIKNVTDLNDGVFTDEDFSINI